ncbi:MAG: acyl carrier protein [Frankiales bacterium]|nr:acyl carrier protein [Frankiales bacterium]
MTPELVLAAVQEAVAIVLEVPAASVLPDQRFAEDLAADSLALVEIIDLLEQRLAVVIPDQDLDDLTTVGLAVDYLVQR